MHLVGRAKKRIQYTRRFVTAVVGFGGKRVGVWPCSFKLRGANGSFVDEPSERWQVKCVLWNLHNKLINIIVS